MVILWRKIKMTNLILISTELFTFILGNATINSYSSRKQIFNMKLYRSALSACVVRDIPNIEDYTYKHYDLVMLENAERLRSIVKSLEHAGSSIYVEIDSMLYINDIKVQQNSDLQNNALVIPVDNMELMEQDINPERDGHNDMIGA